jgi:hypothetical protein
MILLYPQGRYPESFFFRNVSGMDGQEGGGVFDDVKGSWPETWRIGSSMTLWMTLVDPKDHILKVSCHYLYSWLRYMGDIKCDKNMMAGETDKETLLITQFLLCLRNTVLCMWTLFFIFIRTLDLSLIFMVFA